MKKILIIRFSSIGDIIQCMSVVSGLKKSYPDSEIHWLVRDDMGDLLKIHPQIDKIWRFDRSLGLKGLISMVKEIRKEQINIVYDAHSNLRSFVVRCFLNPVQFLFFFHEDRQWVTRRKHRLKRWLLFYFKQNFFPPWAFQAVLTYQMPLITHLGVDFSHTDSVNWQFPLEIEEKVLPYYHDENREGTSQGQIVIVPSAAWELKRWDVDYWKQLILNLSDYSFVILAGPKDAFCEEIKNVAPDRVRNLAGKTSLLESFCIVKNAHYVISGDTGFLHAADLFNKRGIALLGPTAFGATTNPSVHTLEISLSCRPCSKDGSRSCKHKPKKQCLRDITPQHVAREVLMYYKS